MMTKALLLIPAFNESQVLGRVIRSVKQTLKIDILVVDDGSVDATAQVAKLNKVKLIRHIINRGLGAALATGIDYALKNGYAYVITFDSDGQHEASDIPIIIKTLISDKADVVIGSRLLNGKNMPILRKLINILSNFATYLLYGIWTSDSQSGFRGFNRRALEVIQIRSQRMEVSTEIFGEIQKHNLRVKEIPVRAKYTPYSVAKGQPISNAGNVLWKLLLQRLS